VVEDFGTGFRILNELILLLFCNVCVFGG